jgi:hypothetical protein
MSRSSYLQYVNIVKNNLKKKENEWDFKSNSNYRVVLEHVNNEQGNSYLKLLNDNKIFNDNKEYIINLCNENDKFGKPIQSNFENFCKCSPTNLRYIYHSFLIFDYIINKNINNIDIIEIGGGYGGLAFFMYKLANIFNIKISSYIIFDLNDITVLQKKYLELHNIDINALCIENNDDYKQLLNQNSFLISNYGFSELSKEIRDKYSNIISSFISYGFMVWNFIPVYNFINNKITDYPEIPLTGGIQNKYIYIEPN